MSVRIAFLFASSSVLLSASSARREVGQLSNLQHGVGGNVVLLDDTRILIQGFTYDGRGPDAFFYVGRSGRPSESGRLVPFPAGTDEVLERHSGEDVVIELKNGWKTQDIRWISVWCRQFGVNFGELLIPAEKAESAEPASMQKSESASTPSEQSAGRRRKVGELRSLQHKVRGSVYVENATHLLIKDFNYDGEGPDAFFYVGKSGGPSESGQRVSHPPGDFDAVLPRFDSEDVVLTLPDGWKADQLKWLSVWCRKFSVNFGDIFFDGSSSATTVVAPTVLIVLTIASTLWEGLF